MSDRKPMIRVEARTIATDEKVERLEFAASSPSLCVGKLDRFEKPSAKSVEPACKLAFQVRFRWLKGGRVTSAVSFARSFLQFGPSVIPVYGSVRSIRKG